MYGFYPSCKDQHFLWQRIGSNSLFISSSNETFETNLNDEFELNMADFTVNHCTFSYEICHRLMSSNDISGKSLVTFR